MWIRDEAPSHVPGMRAILYGHDSRLVNSTSSQLICDIARDFIEQLRLGQWTLSYAKPLVFLAHSLGGLILKDALVQVAEARDNLNSSLLDKVKGAIMFGVPNLGMEQSHLLAMVEGQPNEILVEDLSRGSNYLVRLDRSFSGIAMTRKLQIFWAYETAHSHTVIVSSLNLVSGEIYRTDASIAERRWGRVGQEWSIGHTRQRSFRNLPTWFNVKHDFPDQSKSLGHGQICQKSQPDQDGQSQDSTNLQH